MQKLKQELNANNVGANCIRPHFAGKTIKKENGITLIALIITIIVMLILVGVTINVALNGGLFDKADIAAKQMQIEADRETLQSAILAAIDNNLKIPNKKALEDNLPNGWTVTLTDEGTYICTSPKGNVFTVTADGKITEGGNTGGGQNPGGEEIDPVVKGELEKYFFDVDETTGEHTVGKALNVTATDVTLSGAEVSAIAFNGDEIISDAETSLLFMSFGIDYIVVEYKGADYKIDAKNLSSQTEAPEAVVGTDGENITKLNTIYTGNTDLIKLQQYFLGYSGEGKYIINLLDLAKCTETTYVFKANSIINENLTISDMVMLSDGAIIYIEYNGSKYKVNVDSNLTCTSASQVQSTGELTYGKVYSGTMETRALGNTLVYEFKIAFSEKYNKAFISVKGEDGSGLVGFSYNKEEKAVTLNDHFEGIVLNLSEDGENLSLYLEDTSVPYSINTVLTDQGPSIKYVANKHSEVNVKNGWYYNKNLDSYICINCYNTSGYNRVWIYCINEGDHAIDRTETMQEVLEKLTTQFGITIIDETHISKDGYTYEFTETLEI